MISFFDRFFCFPFFGDLENGQFFYEVAVEIEVAVVVNSGRGIRPGVAEKL